MLIEIPQSLLVNPTFWEILLTFAGICGILFLALRMERWALHNGRRFTTPP